MAIQWNDSGTTVNLLATTMDNLSASSTRILSSAISAGGDLFGDLELYLAVQSLVSTGVTVAEVYFLPTVDGTNYADGAAGTDPQNGLLAAAFAAVSVASGTAMRLMAPGVPLPVRNFKALLKNPLSGISYASAPNTLKLNPYTVSA